uniref:Dzip-like_N domain-containing protein n=1 Tax=Haemonchus placei TaxID=6290 RepID=A0A0N4WN89_HAEPC
LNAAYYRLLERSDKMLMMLQRKLPADPSLHFPTTILTSVQVHILNPVDIMRAVLDEGVCCFPYGAILDKTNAILDQIEYMLYGGEHVGWEPVALMAKKASLHYRTHLERTMEERLGEGLRLKAAQRILRLDSFLVESTVTKLEKDTTKARDELKWELEQLQQQNAQLRKDNRQLKMDHMRLETRVEVLEQKFKTLARLLS